MLKISNTSDLTEHGPHKVLLRAAPRVVARLQAAAHAHAQRSGVALRLQQRLAERVGQL